MLVGRLKVLINMSWYISALNHLKTQKMCNKAVRMEPYLLEFVPDHLNTPEMCNKTVRINPYTLKYVPDHLETLETYNEAVRIKPAPLSYYRPL